MKIVYTTRITHSPIASFPTMTHVPRVGEYVIVDVRAFEVKNVVHADNPLTGERIIYVIVRHLSDASETYMFTHTIDR